MSIIELIYQIQEASGIYKEVDMRLFSSISNSITGAKLHNKRYTFSQEEIAVIYLHEKFGLPFSICNVLGINDSKILEFKRKYRKEDIRDAEERLNTFLLYDKDKEFIEEYNKLLQSFKMVRTMRTSHPFSYVQITLYNLLMKKQMKKQNKSFILKDHRYGISDSTSRAIQKDIKKALSWI